MKTKINIKRTGELKQPTRSRKQITPRHQLRPHRIAFYRNANDLILLWRALSRRKGTTAMSCVIMCAADQSNSCWCTAVKVTGRTRNTNIANCNEAIKNDQLIITNILLLWLLIIYLYYMLIVYWLLLISR